MNSKEWDKIKEVRERRADYIKFFIQPYDSVNPGAMFLFCFMMLALCITIPMSIFVGFSATGLIISFSVAFAISIPAIFIFYHNVRHMSWSSGTIVVSKKHCYHLAEIKRFIHYSDWGMGVYKIQFEDFEEEISTRKLRKANKREQLLYYLHGSVSIKNKDYKENKNDVDENVCASS